jgi:hypothetical protein
MFFHLQRKLLVQHGLVMQFFCLVLDQILIIYQKQIVSISFSQYIVKESKKKWIFKLLTDPSLSLMMQPIICYNKRLWDIPVCKSGADDIVLLRYIF